jgi:endonuclease III
MPRPAKAPAKAAARAVSKKAAAKAADKAPKPSKSAEQTRQIMALLFQQHPNAFTELDFRNPYELLTATILSAQSTDKRVNEVTPALFAKYPNATTLAQANPKELEVEIMSTGFFRQKTKALIGMAKAVVDNFDGEIPGRMEDLVTLTGVGRKTANVVLSHAFGVPGLAVDRHVLRVSNRIGIAVGTEAEVVESQLCAAMPPEQWQLTSDSLILHGRRICRPFPLCPQCAVVDLCDFAAELRRKAPNKLAPKPTKPIAPKRLAPKPVAAKAVAKTVAKSRQAAKAAKPIVKATARRPAK